MSEDKKEDGSATLGAERAQGRAGRGRRRRLAMEKKSPAALPPAQGGPTPSESQQRPGREGERRDEERLRNEQLPSAPMPEESLRNSSRAERPGRGGRKQRALARRSDALVASAAAAPVQPLAAPLAPWPEPGEHVQVLLTMQKSRKRRFLLRLALFCGLPTLLTAIYMFFIASPRYISEAKITYQTYQPPRKLSQGLVQTLLGTSQSNTVDLGVVLDQYIQSTTLLKKLDSGLHLRKYYSSSKVDFLSRMNPNASLGTFARYYHWYVSSSYALGGYLTIKVEAFDPQFAQKLARAIVKACDQMVNDLSARARQDEVKYAEDELKLEEARVRKARLALTDFQDAHRDINPPESASQLTGIVGKLQSDLALAQTQLGNLLAYMSPTSPQVVATNDKIAAIEKQLKEQKEQLANSGNGTPYSKILEKYSALQLDEEFARNAYKAAQQGLEVARADAARQVSYLIDFAPPYLPNRSNVSIPIVYTVTVLISSLVLFGIGSLIAAAFRDHAGI